MSISDRTYTRRRAVLNAARNLARSGQHEGCSTIIPQVAAAADYDLARAWFADHALRAQLDGLCAMARARTTPTARRA
jgi:hypothetical protein